MPVFWRESGRYGRCILTTREASRIDIQTNSPSRLEHINTGSLQRIADATEKMAASYDSLRETKDWAVRRGDDYLARLTCANHQIRALKGVITKMRNRGVR